MCATMATATPIVLALVVVIIFSLLPKLPVVKAQIGGFSIELIHHESPLSPFYNPSDTYSDRIRKAARHSIARTKLFRSSSSTNLDTIQSDVIPNDGSYLMKLSIGTPPLEVLAIADTGSDLIWTQCKPCQECYEQDANLFDPIQSSTYREISCQSDYCQSLPRAHCGNTSQDCQYLYSYGDESHTNGILATETFTFDSTTGRPIAIPTLVFGCGHNNAGTFSSQGSGLIGLGGGHLSLVSQLGSKIEGKFSYCLVPMSEKHTSKLNFGSQAVISGQGVVSTPLVPKDPDTYYYLTLEGISVGNIRIENNKISLNQEEGNIVIDSGTTLTILDEALYTNLESTVKEAINLDTYPDPEGTFGLCYSTKSDIKVPEFTFHFTGADLQLNEMNTFIKISDDLVCLSMVPAQSLSIFGNLAQINFQVEYDLVGKKVSFTPADCIKY